MHFRRASFLSRNRLPGAAIAAATAGLLLAACGGGHGNQIEWETAFQVVGHKDFQNDSVDDGNKAGPQQYSLATPAGNVGTDGKKLYVADTGRNRVLVWTSLPTSNGQNANLVIGQADFNSQVIGNGLTQLSAPTSASLGAGGQLIVADTGNNRVLIWNTAPTTQAAINHGPDVIIGDGGVAASATSLSGPTSATIAGTKLLVSDTGNNRVLIWNTVPANNTIPADYVLGQPDFVSTGNDDSNVAMYQPTSVWSNGTRVLVADAGNYRVMYWSTFPRASGAKATNVVGQADWGRSVHSTSASTFQSPTSVTSDGAQFWVADSGSNRVLKFSSLPTTNGMSASLVYGQGNQSFTASAANDDNQDGKTDNDSNDQQYGAATEHTLNNPSGVAVVNNVLYITDSGNSRVELYAP